MRPSFRLSTRAFVIIEATCLLVGLYSCHAGIQAETRAGRRRDLITFSLIGWDAGIAVEPRALGTTGYLEPWYRTPNAEDLTVVLRIYGAAALPGTPARPHPVRDPGLCVTLICPPLHAAPEPPSAPERWLPRTDPPRDVDLRCGDRVASARDHRVRPAWCQPT